MIMVTSTDGEPFRWKPLAVHSASVGLADSSREACTAERFHRPKAKRVYKPGSVFVWSSIWGTNCFAPPAVYRKDRRATLTPPLTLLPMGFSGQARHHAPGALLPHHFTLTGAEGIGCWVLGVRKSYANGLPNEQRAPTPNTQHPIPSAPAVSFCCTFRRVAPPRR